MRIDRLTLRNYRCFDALAIDFDPEMTVLIAPNGAGKTTVLDAVRVALWPLVKGFDLGSSQSGKGATIQPDDVRRLQMGDGNMEPQLPCKITVEGAYGKPDDLIGVQSWSLMRESMQPRSNTLAAAETRQLTHHGKLLDAFCRSGAEVTLPLIAYLGTSRLWYEARYTSQVADTTLDSNEYSRTSGYLNCLAYSSSFKAFAAWYSWLFRSYRESQLIALEREQPLDADGLRLQTCVRAIQQAIDTLIKPVTGWERLEYSQRHQQQLIMYHPQHGVMPVEQLSDGLRNAIAMVADLAFRACKLNPHLGANAVLQTPGIALIDEVDMFLHPSWQQQIIGALRQAFPALQFIVTTHSPQVVSTLPKRNICVLDQDPEGHYRARQPEFSPLAHESGDALTRLQ